MENELSQQEWEKDWKEEFGALTLGVLSGEKGSPVFVNNDFEIIRLKHWIAAQITKAKTDAYRDALAWPNKLLRSAHAIAKRRGVRTNWEAFTIQLDRELKREHAIMFPANNHHERKEAHAHPAAE